MLAGAAIGAGLLQLSPSGAIGLAAALAGAVAVAFATGRVANNPPTAEPSESAARGVR